MAEKVVFVHGLYMIGLELTLLRHRVARTGFETRQFSYRSLSRGLDENARELGVFLGGLPVTQLHLVAHSLGGLVICRMFEQMNLDPAYGLSLPAKIAALGLKILRVDAQLHLNRGSDPMARMMGESTRALRDKYLATGAAGPTDVETYIRHANDSSLWSVYYSTVSVVGVQTGVGAPG